MYYSQCGGVVERFNWTLLDMLATMVKDHLFNWEYVPPAQSVLCLHFQCALLHRVHFSDVWVTGAAATGPNVWHRTTERGFNQQVCSKIEAVTVGGLCLVANKALCAA